MALYGYRCPCGADSECRAPMGSAPKRMKCSACGKKTAARVYSTGAIHMGKVPACRNHFERPKTIHALPFDDPDRVVHTPDQLRRVMEEKGLHSDPRDESGITSPCGVAAESMNEAGKDLMYSRLDEGLSEVITED